MEEEYKKILDHLSKVVRNSQEDRCYGSIVGALVGDPMGTFLEGNTLLPKDDEIKKCVNMTYEDDKFYLPGQISIDGEFILMNMKAILNSNKNLDVNQDQIQIQGLSYQLSQNLVYQKYLKLIKENPEDRKLGKTLSQSLEKGKKRETKNQEEEKKVESNQIEGSVKRENPCYPQSYKECCELASALNKHSFSNSSLVRVIPLAVWLSALPLPQKEDQQKKNFQTYTLIKAAVECDCRLTHSNLLVQECVYIYACAIHYLISNPQDRSRCLNAFQLAQELSVFDGWEKKIEDDEDFEAVYYWLNEAMLFDKWAQDLEKTSKDLLVERFNARDFAGCIKHGFVLAFYQLLRLDKQMNKENVSDNVYSNFYKKAIMDTVSIAGDTNTNASIVSGLIGAAIGVHAIQQAKIDQDKKQGGEDQISEKNESFFQKVFCFYSNNQNNPKVRDQEFNTGHDTLLQIQELIAKRPTSQFKIVE